MITLLIPAVSGVATVVATYEACDRIAVRLRAARHRRLTRKHGRMLTRPYGGAR